MTTFNIRYSHSIQPHQNVVPALVPLEREDGSLVLPQRVLQLARRRPDARVPVVGAGRQEAPAAVPVQGSHVLVARVLLSASVDAVPEDDLALRVGQAPDARRAVPRVSRAEEDLHLVVRYLL